VSKKRKAVDTVDINTTASKQSKTNDAESPAKRVCSLCHEPNHNKRACPKNPKKSVETPTSSSSPAAALVNMRDEPVYEDESRKQKPKRQFKKITNPKDAEVIDVSADEGRKQKPKKQLGFLRTKPDGEISVEIIDDTDDEDENSSVSSESANDTNDDEE